MNVSSNSSSTKRSYLHRYVGYVVARIRTPMNTFASHHSASFYAKRRSPLSVGDDDQHQSGDERTSHTTSKRLPTQHRIFVCIDVCTSRSTAPRAASLYHRYVRIALIFYNLFWFVCCCSLFGAFAAFIILCFIFISLSLVCSFRMCAERAQRRPIERTATKCARMFVASTKKLKALRLLLIPN